MTSTAMALNLSNQRVHAKKYHAWCISDLLSDVQARSVTLDALPSASAKQGTLGTLLAGVVNDLNVGLIVRILGCWRYRVDVEVTVHHYLIAGQLIILWV